MKIVKVVIGACAAALFMSGCMTEDLIKQRAADERIKMVGTRSFSIELLSAKTMINDEGLLTVDASALLSRTGFFRWVFSGDPAVTVWYHFTWIDAQGNIYPPVQREMTALPGNIIDFHGVAPEEKYINYHLTISLKGPESEKDADKKHKQEMKKKYVKDGKVKPAGKSRAKLIRKSKKQKKAAKPAEQKNAKPAAPKAVKPAEQKAAKPAAQKAAAEPAAKPAPKQQKLTEPFN